MQKKINALGNYLNEKSNKKMNFKMIKTDRIYRDMLFSVGTEDYVVGTSKEEVVATLLEMSASKAWDFPPKLVKRYTHAKFQKAKKKISEIVQYNYLHKRYFIVFL